MRNGLAEAVKYGIIRDSSLFAYLKKNYKKVISRNPAVLTHVVERCSKIKVDVVVAAWLKAVF
jgi:3-dehydroquinate synthase